MATATLTRHTPIEVVSTDGMPEEEWKDWRRKGIGGSEVAAIMGCSPFTTARDLYRDKVGIKPAVEDEGNWVAMEVGHRLESLVAEIFHRKTGLKVFQIKKMFAHPDYPFMQANVDYFVETLDGQRGILEIKTSSVYAKEKWADETVPSCVCIGFWKQLWTSALTLSLLSISENCVWTQSCGFQATCPVMQKGN